jgi:hypothetical protein
MIKLVAHLICNLAVARSNEEATQEIFDSMQGWTSGSAFRLSFVLPRRVPSMDLILSSSRATASLTGVGGVTGLAVDVEDVELGVDGEETEGDDGGVSSLEGTGGALSFPLTACEIP